MWWSTLTVRLSLALSCCVALVIGQSYKLSAQQPIPRPGEPNSPYRKLVPGIVTTIKPDRQANETISHQDLVELKVAGDDVLKWPPQTLSETQTLRFAIKETPLRRSVWCLEFNFKPMRMVAVDFPGPNGKMQQKMVWYLVYRINNTGKHLQPVMTDEGTWDVKEQDALTQTVNAVDQPLPIRFVPHFSLETLDKKKLYLDRLIPVAIPVIQQREDPNRKLLNSAEMSEVTLAVSTKDRDNSVWGVATWEDVDARIDQFSIYVGGLSNAYRFIDPPGAFKAGATPGTGRLHQNKYLQLNFWRPSDEFNLSETPIYYGLPQKDEEGKEIVIDHRWVFR